MNFLIEIISIEENPPFKLIKEFLDQNKLKDEKELKDNLKKNLINQYENYLKKFKKNNLMDILECKK